MLLAGPSSDGPALVDLHAGLREAATGSPLFEAAIALGTRPDLPVQIGHLEPIAADLLGVEGTTLLAVRPDGYIACDPTKTTSARSSATAHWSIPGLPEDWLVLCIRSYNPGMVRLVTVLIVPVILLCVIDWRLLGATVRQHACAGPIGVAACRCSHRINGEKENIGGTQ